MFHAQDYKAHRLYVFIWRGTSPCKETEHTLSDVEANRARGITFQIKRNAFGIHWQNLPPAIASGLLPWEMKLHSSYLDICMLCNNNNNKNQPTKIIIEIRFGSKLTHTGI